MNLLITRDRYDNLVELSADVAGLLDADPSVEGGDQGLEQLYEVIEDSEIAIATATPDFLGSIVDLCTRGKSVPADLVAQSRGENDLSDEEALSIAGLESETLDFLRDLALSSRQRMVSSIVQLPVPARKILAATLVLSMDG